MEIMLRSDNKLGERKWNQHTEKERKRKKANKNLHYKQRKYHTRRLSEEGNNIWKQKKILNESNNQISRWIKGADHEKWLKFKTN